MMKRAVKRISGTMRRWWRGDRGMALIETTLLFPVMLSLLMGVYDLGQGIVVNQKTISSSQVMADLISRNQNIDMALLNDIVIAGRMTMEPYTAVAIGYDIVSISFDEDEAPVVIWRVTENMAANATAVESTEGLGEEGDGMVIVTVNYQYIPFFSNFLFDRIDMSEVAFLAGRRSATVQCADCPAG